jgi:hypothetical protein
MSDESLTLTPAEPEMHFVKNSVCSRTRMNGQPAVREGRQWFISREDISNLMRPQSHRADGHSVEGAQVTSSPTLQDRVAFYGAAALGLRALDARERTARRFGSDAQARWAQFAGALKDGDRLDTLLRDAAGTWGAAFSPSECFGFWGLADDEPFGPDWGGIDDHAATRLFSEPTGQVTLDMVAAAPWCPDGGGSSPAADAGYQARRRRWCSAGRRHPGVRKGPRAVMDRSSRRYRGSFSVPTACRPCGCPAGGPRSYGPGPPHRRRDDGAAFCRIRAHRRGHRLARCRARGGRLRTQRGGQVAWLSLPGASTEAVGRTTRGSGRRST